MFDKLFLFHTSETLKQRDFQIIELKMKTEQFEAITSKSDSISNSFLTELTSPMASLDNQFFSSSTYPLTSPNSINSTSTAISSQTNSCFASAPVNVSSSSPLLSSSLSISSTLPSKPPPSSANSFSPITDSISDGPFVSALYPSLSNSLPSARLFTLNHQPSMFHANLPVAQPSCTGENDNLLLSLSGLSSSPQVVSTTITTSPIPSSQGIFDSVRLPTGWPLSTQSQSEGPSDTSASKEDNVGASEMQDNLDSLNSSSMVEEGMHVAHLPPVDSALFFPGLHQLDDRFPGPGQSHLLPNPAYTVSQGFIAYHTPGPVRRPANWNSNHATATINGTPPSNNQLTPIMFNGASGEDSSVTCDDPSSPLLADLLMVKAAAGLTAVMGRCETMNSRVLSTLAAATAAAEASSSGAANIGPQAVLSNECPGSTNNTSAIATSTEGECSISPISVSRAPSNSIINHHQHQLQQAILSAPHSPGRQSRLLRLSGGSSGSCAGSGNGFSFHEEEPHDPSSFGDTPIIASVDSGLLRDPPPNKQQLPERRYQLSQSTSIGLQIPITSSLSQLSNGFLETTAISSPATDQIIEQNLSSTSFETSGLRISAPVVRLPPSSTLSSSSSVLSASTTSDVSLLTPKSSSFSSSPFLTPFTTSQVANSAFQPSTFSGDGEITFQESSAHQLAKSYLGPTHDLSVYRGPTSCRMPILNPPANYSQPTDNQSPMSQISPKQKAQLDDTIHEPQLLHQRHHPSPHRSSQHHNRLMKMCKQAGSQLPTPYPTGFSTGIQGVYQQNGFLSSNGLPAHILSMAHSSSHFSDNSVSNFITSSAGPCSSGCDYSHSDSLNTFTATQQLQRPYMNGFIKSQTPSYLGFMPTTATASIADSSGTVGTGDALIESEDAFLSMLRQQAKANTSSVQLGSLLAATASASSVAMSICPSTLSTSSSAFSTELRNNSLSSDYKFHSGGGNFSPTPLHHLGAPGQMVSGCPSERFLESLLVPGCSGLESELGPVTSGGAESLGARLTKRERFMSELDLTASVEDCCTSLGSLSAVNGSANAVDRRRRRDMLTSSLLSSVLSE